MELFFYRCQKPNFGDELNTWMWPRLLNGVWDGDDNTTFIGIGSVINDQFPAHRNKIVFGAGYGGYTALPTIDERWKFYFVRGRHTARTLGLDERLGIGDAAILLRSLIPHGVPKRYKVSFMPHWETTLDGNWELACQLGGIHYIDPCAPVEQVLAEIQASELVLTEAMHGAIVSDALRVPWIPIKPLVSIHHMKWHDWASALDLELKPVAMLPSSLLEIAALHFHEHRRRLADRIREQARFLQHVGSHVFANRAAERLNAIGRSVAPSLSSDRAISMAHEQMLGKLDELVADLGRGKVLC